MHRFAVIYFNDPFILSFIDKHNMEQVSKFPQITPQCLCICSESECNDSLENLFKTASKKLQIRTVLIKFQ